MRRHAVITGPSGGTSSWLWVKIEVYKIAVLENASQLVCIFLWKRWMTNDKSSEVHRTLHKYFSKGVPNKWYFGNPIFSIIVTNFCYFCNSRNNIEIWIIELFSVQFSPDSEYLLKNSDILFGSISERFKFLKLSTTIRFSCYRTSKWQLCIRTLTSLRWSETVLIIRSPRVSPAFECECETSYT